MDLYTCMCDCVRLCPVSGEHAAELQQPGSWEMCLHHWELRLWLHSCRHGSPLHQGPVQGYAYINLLIYTHSVRTHKHNRIKTESHSDSGVQLMISCLSCLQAAKTWCICSFAGTLTAVESFLTVSSGPDVCHYHVSLPIKCINRSSLM